MKYVSLDLETMGVEDRSPERILMISMVAEDTEKPEIPVEELPHFTAIIQHRNIVGEPTALAMNAWLLVAIDYSKTKMSEPDFTTRYLKLGIPLETICKGVLAAQRHRIDGCIQNMVIAANDWLDAHFGKKDKITLAGKNAAGFDMTFLPLELKNRFRHSVIDPGTMFWNPAHDRMLPHSDEVMKRAGVEYAGAHDALADARMVISAVRKSPYFILQKALALLSEAASDNFDRSKLADLYGQIPAYLKERK